MATNGCKCQETNIKVIKYSNLAWSIFNRIQIPLIDLEWSIIKKWRVGIHITAQADNRTAQRSLKPPNIVLSWKYKWKNSRRTIISVHFQNSITIYSSCWNNKNSQILWMKSKGMHMTRMQFMNTGAREIVSFLDTTSRGSKVPNVCI